MRVDLIFGRNTPKQFHFHFIRSLSRCQTGTVCQPKKMGIDRHGGLPKGHIEHHVGRFAPYTGQGLQRLARARYRAAMLIHQDLTRLHQMLGFGAKQPDGLDVALQIFQPQGQYFLRRVGYWEEPTRGFVDAHIRGLGRQ